MKNIKSTLLMALIIIGINAACFQNFKLGTNSAKLLELNDSGVNGNKILLGRGTWGMVFKLYLTPDQIFPPLVAHKSHLDSKAGQDTNINPVAVKIFNNQVPNYLMTISQEAEMLETVYNLTAGQISPEFYYCAVNGNTDDSFIVMEYFNENLLNYMMNHNYLTLLERMNIMYGLLDSLAILHSKLIFHCDIKPENIVFQSDIMKFKFVDFGITVFNKECIGGTIEYQSPETMGIQSYSNDRVYGFEPKGSKSDIYSMGIIFWTLEEECEGAATTFNRLRYEQGVTIDFKQVVEEISQKSLYKTLNNKSDLHTTLIVLIQKSLHYLLKLMVLESFTGRPTASSLKIRIQLLIMIYTRIIKLDSSAIDTKEVTKYIEFVDVKNYDLEVTRLIFTFSEPMLFVKTKDVKHGQEELKMDIEMSDQTQLNKII